MHGNPDSWSHALQAECTLMTADYLLWGTACIIYCCRKSPGYTNGLRSMRHYSKPSTGTWSDGGWRAVGSQLRSPRWYPTQVSC
jgi:hypothetical protein